MNQEETSSVAGFEDALFSSCPVSLIYQYSHMFFSQSGEYKNSLLLYPDVAMDLSLCLDLKTLQNDGIMIQRSELRGSQRQRKEDQGRNCFQAPTQAGFSPEWKLTLWDHQLITLVFPLNSEFGCDH